MGKLSVTRIRALSGPRRYQDGDGLMLVIGAAGSASWILRIQVNGQRRDVGLGSLTSVTLAEAREKAAQMRKQFRGGSDPVAERKIPKLAVPTFEQAARSAYLERKRGWKNGKHQLHGSARSKSTCFRRSANSR